MCNRLWTLGGALGAVLLMTGAPAIGEVKTTVEMEEISVFDEAESAQLRSAGLSPRTRYLSCSSVRPSEVKTYPELHSDRPIYGSVLLGQDPAKGETGVRFYYVIDESETKTEAPEGGSLLDSLAGALTNTPDGNGAEGKYDRLYFDANHNGDLTDDKVIEGKQPPRPADGCHVSGLVAAG